MELFEAIAKRHSYRGPFKTRAVNREDLRQIVRAGIQAPSGCNQQTTEFVIIDDPDTLSAIRSMHPTNAAMRRAAAYICCIVDREPEPVYEDLSFQVEDCAAATENMLLAVTALGYATVWVDGWLRREKRADKIAALLDLPATKTIRIILPIGVPETREKQAERKPFDERARFNR